MKQDPRGALKILLAYALFYASIIALLLWLWMRIGF